MHSKGVIHDGSEHIISERRKLIFVKINLFKGQTVESMFVIVQPTPYHTPTPAQPISDVTMKFFQC